jgi:hypothetical protein
VLLVILRAVVATREDEDHRIVPLQLPQMVASLRMVGQLVIGEGAPTSIEVGRIARER